MRELIVIAWFVALIVSVFSVHVYIGNHGLDSMFPEGRRWWTTWAGLGSLAVFAAVVLANPFTGWLA